MANNMMQFIQIIPFLRSLCFGGLLGTAVAIALCFYFEQPQNTYYIAGSLGGLFGAAIQRGLIRIFTPIVNSLAFYIKLFEIEVLKRNKLVDDITYDGIKRHKISSYFIVGNSGDGPATDKNSLSELKGQWAEGSGEK